MDDAIEHFFDRIRGTLRLAGARADATVEPRPGTAGAAAL